MPKVYSTRGENSCSSRAPARESGGTAYRRMEMKKAELIAPCHFGLEGVLIRERSELGYEISHVENVRVNF